MASMTLTAAPTSACQHKNLASINVDTGPDGSPAILRISGVTCKDCGQKMELNAGKGWFPGLQILLKAADGKAAPPAKKLTLREEIGDGPGTELAEELERLGVSSCQACKAQAVVMNANGAAWCRENVDALVADILPRARAWADHATLQEKLALWWQSDMTLAEKLKAGVKAATWQLDESLKVAIRSRVLAAVERWEATRASA